MSNMSKILFTNNARKMLGIPLHRKKDKQNRAYTRNRADEVLEAIMNYWDGRWDEYDNGKQGERRT